MAEPLWRAQLRTFNHSDIEGLVLNLADMRLPSGESMSEDGLNDVVDAVGRLLCANTVKELTELGPGSPPEARARMILWKVAAVLPDDSYEKILPFMIGWERRIGKWKDDVQDDFRSSVTELENQVANIAMLPFRDSSLGHQPEFLQFVDEITTKLQPAEGTRRSRIRKGARASFIVSELQNAELASPAALLAWLQKTFPSRGGAAKPQVSEDVDVSRLSRRQMPSAEAGAEEEMPADPLATSPLPAPQVAAEATAIQGAAARGRLIVEVSPRAFLSQLLFPGEPNVYLTIPNETRKTLQLEEGDFTVDRVAIPRVALPSHVRHVGPTLRLGPHGVKFPKSVVLSFPFDLQEHLHGEELSFYVLEEGSSSWAKVPGGVFAGGWAHLRREHFCDLTLGQEGKDSCTVSFHILRDQRMATILFVPQGCLECKEAAETALSSYREEKGMALVQTINDVELVPPCRLQWSKVDDSGSARFDWAFGQLKGFEYDEGVYQLSSVHEGQEAVLLGSFELTRPAQARIADFHSKAPRSMFLFDDKSTRDQEELDHEREFEVLERVGGNKVVAPTMEMLLQYLDQNPELVFFSCHRDEDKLFLLSECAELLNEDLVEILRDRHRTQRPNPGCVVLNTCGGPKLPRMLVEDAQLKFVVYWPWGKSGRGVPDIVAGLFTDLFCEFLLLRAPEVTRWEREDFVVVFQRSKGALYTGIKRLPNSGGLKAWGNTYACQCFPAEFDTKPEVEQEATTLESLLESMAAEGTASQRG